MEEEVLVSLYESFLNSIPSYYHFLIPLVIFTLVFIFYSFYAFSFYKLLAKRDILELNLRPKFSKKHSFYNFFTIIFFVLEYLIIMPILCLLWFGSLSILLLSFSKTPSVASILMMSCALVATVRIISYFSEDLSKDLAKIVPFTLLTLFIIGENFFDVSLMLERIVQINQLWPLFPLYAVFIFLAEFIMRMAFLPKDLFSKT